MSLSHGRDKNLHGRIITDELGKRLVTTLAWFVKFRLTLDVMLTAACLRSC